MFLWMRNLNAVFTSLHVYTLSCNVRFSIQVKILIDASSVMTDIDLYKHSNGSKLFPSRTCKDLRKSQPTLKSGAVVKFIYR